jgi:hypothetical protein
MARERADLRVGGERRNQSVDRVAGENAVRIREDEDLSPRALRAGSQRTLFPDERGNRTTWTRESSSAIASSRSTVRSVEPSSTTITSRFG